eukprot:COSAG06_NODE_594_length_13939_cov_45.080202_10_plen_108_part_00
MIDHFSAFEPELVADPVSRSFSLFGAIIMQYERAPLPQLDQAVDAVVHRRVPHHQRLHLFLRQEVQGCACQRIAVLNRLDARVRAGPATKTTFLSFPYVCFEPVLVK